MKVAVLSENEADEDAVLVWTSAAYGQQVERANVPNKIRTRGWAVLDILCNVIPSVHYSSDADALVFVVDSDGTPVHTDAHQRGSPAPNCRFCKARRIAQHAVHGLSPRAYHPTPVLRVAIGLAAPCHEAWLRCGQDPGVSEAIWISALEKGGPLPYTRQSLKQAVYRTAHPSLELQRQRMVEEAERVVRDLGALERLFPNGFGQLAREVRSWRPSPAPT